MCSVDFDDGDQFMKIEDPLIRTAICKKCKADDSNIVLRKKDVYCRLCFLNSFIHKFRSTIGKSKQIKHNEKILVAISCGKSSMAMVNLIKDGLKESTAKKLRFVPLFLHIDEYVINEVATREFILQLFEENSYPLYVSNLEDFFCEAINFNDSCSIDLSVQEDRIKKLKNMFLSCSSGSSKEDLCRQMRLKVICMCAKALNINKVFLGDNSSAIAYNTLAQMAYGRGSQVAQLTHFKSELWGIEVYRPMKEISCEEINFYTDINKLPILNFKKCEQAPSILSCTRQFIDNLSVDFGSTIPTICRTANKMAFNDTHQLKDRKTNLITCSFCGLVVDINHGEDTALSAKVLSKLISSSNPSSQRAVNEILSADLKNGIEQTNINSNEEKLCFGCQGIQRDMKNLELLSVTSK